MVGTMPHNAFPSSGINPRRIRRLILVCCLITAGAITQAAWAANISIGSGIRVSPPVRTMKDLRDKDLVKQQFDYSCGAAAAWQP